MQVNNRTPTFLGDLRAQVGAAQLGVRRLKEVIARYGVDAVRGGGATTSIAYAARRFREEVARWPDGVYESDAYVDHDPHGNQDIHVHCKVTVAGRSTSPSTSPAPTTRPNIQAYSTFGNTRGYVVAQLAVDDGPDDPEERGLLRLDRADRARGLLPESAAGQARSPRARTIPAPRSARRSPRRSTQVVPERCCPQIYKMGMPTVIFGTQPAHRAALHRPLGRHLRRLLRRGARARTAGAR